MVNISQKELLDLEAAAISIVEKAGKYVLENWNKIHAKKLKNERDIVTNVDIEVETSLRESLHSLLPEAGFVVEEGKSDLKSDINWSIDPIDGTKNFAFLYPLFSVQIALLFRGKPILGIINNPVSSQIFSASTNNGAKLNGNLIKLSPRPDLSSAIVDVDFGGKDSIIDWKLELLDKLTKSVFRVRMTGGFASTYMLTGAFDASVYLNPQTKKKYVVDNSPRIILLQEAGFQTELIAQKEGKKIFLAASTILAEKLKNIIL